LLSVEDFKDTFKHYTVIYLEKGFKNSYVEKRNAVNKKNYRFNFTIDDTDLPGESADVKSSSTASETTPSPPSTDAKAKAAINLGEMGNDEDLQTKPVDSLNLMLSNQIKATLMDDDGGENEGEEEDEDDEVQAGTDAEANDGEQADNTPDGNQTG